MSVIDAPPVVPGDGGPAAAVRRSGSFVEPLVDRLSREYGEDPEAVRQVVTEVLAGFAGAPVQAFVPILVEKQVRQLYRRRNGPLTALYG